MWICLPCGEGRFILLYESSATVLIAHSRLLRLISQALSAFSRDFLCYWWLGRIPIKLQLTSRSCLILDFVVNVLEILVWYEKRLVGACVGFPLKNRERKEAGEYIRKKNGLSIWDNLSSHFFFCYLDGKGKVLKLLCDVWKEVIFKMKKIVQTISSPVLQLFGRSMYMMLFLKDASGLSKSTNELDSILLSCHCSLKLSVIIWSTCLPVRIF